MLRDRGKPIGGSMSADEPNAFDAVIGVEGVRCFVCQVGEMVPPTIF